MRTVWIDDQVSERRMMGKKKTKIKADYTMKLNSLTYIAYPYPFQKAIVFILWLSLGSPFTLSFYVYVGSFFNLLLCAISIYTILFWNVDSWWNSDFLQSSDSIDLCSMNTWALSMWLNIFIQLVNDAMIQRAAKCKWEKHRNYEEQRDVCFSKCYDLILHEKKNNW